MHLFGRMTGDAEVTGLLPACRYPLPIRRQAIDGVSNFPEGPVPGSLAGNSPNTPGSPTLGGQMPIALPPQLTFNGKDLKFCSDSGKVRNTRRPESLGQRAHGSPSTHSILIATIWACVAMRLKETEPLHGRLAMAQMI